MPPRNSACMMGFEFFGRISWNFLATKTKTQRSITDSWGKCHSLVVQLATIQFIFKKDARNSIFSCFGVKNYSLTSFYNNHLDDLFGAIWIPIFPKICNRGFSETKTSHLSSNFRFRKVQITEITTQKNPWSADPGPGLKKIKICTQVITTEMSPDEMFFGKKIVFFVASHDQVQSFCCFCFGQHPHRA